MSLASDMAVLRRVPFFERFGDDHLRLLAFGGENMRFKANDTLFSSGDATEGGLVILSGQVLLTTARQKDDDDGERFKVGTLLGQRALLAETKRRHTATAVTGVEVMSIRRALFKRMLSEYPDLATQLYASMSSELLSLTAQASVVVGGKPKF
ncbi:MAG: cyclic nucleotide-binding domain-containing protein [Devosiaceae bacterium]